MPLRTPRRVALQRPCAWMGVHSIFASHEEVVCRRGGSAAHSPNPCETVLHQSLSIIQHQNPPWHFCAIPFLRPRHHLFPNPPIPFVPYHVSVCHALSLVFLSLPPSQSDDARRNVFPTVGASDCGNCYWTGYRILMTRPVDEAGIGVTTRKRLSAQLAIETIVSKRVIGQPHTMPQHTKG